MLTFQEERLRDGFSKFHIGNLGFPAVIHKITEADMNGLIHNHPSGMWSFVMNGSYWEKRYYIHEDGTYGFNIFHRKKGDSFRIEANTIHEIISLPQGECVTMTIPDEEKVEWGFYEFRQEGVFYRPHYEQEFKPYKL